MITTIDNMDMEYYVTCPDPPQIESQILFTEHSISEQYWRKEPVPKSFKSARAKVEYWDKEIERCFITGQWIAIKGELYWLTPQYYFFLKHWAIPAKKEGAEFRMKRWKHSLFKWLVKSDPRLIGTYTIKNRRDGETINSMSDMVNEALTTDAGLFGIQSKTMADSKEVCWRQLMFGFKRLHKTFKINPNGTPIWQGTTDPKKALNFKRIATHIGVNTRLEDYEDEDDQETSIYYAATVANAFDGREMRKIVIDEFNKWEEASAIAAYQTYIDCVLMGNARRGLMDIFSSPSETQGEHNDNAFKFWKMCDPRILDEETGVTKSRVLRWFSNPLEGIETFYDKYGFADADRIHTYLMTRRNAVPPEMRQSEVRKNPLDEREAFESFDSNTQWANADGITARKIYLMKTDFKDEVTKAKKYVGVSLDWKDMVPDTEVVPKIYPHAVDFSENCRFLFTEFPQNLPKLDNIFRPPKVPNAIIGIDPYDYRRVKNSTTSSKGAAVNYRFTNLFGQPERKAIPFIYLARPDKPAIFYEDMIKAAVFTQSLVQAEAKNKNIQDHFEDRGYFDWMMPSDYNKDKDDKGNSPSGQTGFLDDVCGLIDGHLSVAEFNEAYFLDNIWFEQLLDDVEKFDRSDTHKFDLAMALGQAFFGAQKWLMRINRRRHLSSNFASTLAYFT